jgi:hypothetical protein
MAYKKSSKFIVAVLPKGTIQRLTLSKLAGHRDRAPLSVRPGVSPGPKTAKDLRPAPTVRHDSLGDGWSRSALHRTRATIVRSTTEFVAGTIWRPAPGLGLEPRLKRRRSSEREHPETDHAGDHRRDPRASGGGTDSEMSDQGSSREKDSRHRQQLVRHCRAPAVRAKARESKVGSRRRVD